MSLAVVYSRALRGLEAPRVRVEVHLANGLPSFTLVGLADTEVKEARERVRAALAQSGLEFPMNKRVTVNLAPADLPKASARFDLPIALGILAANEQLPVVALEGLEFAGELSLDGALQPLAGTLALALAFRRETLGPDGTRLPAEDLPLKEQAAPPPGLVLPTDSARQAGLVPGLDVYGADNLQQVVLALQARGQAMQAHRLDIATQAEAADAPARPAAALHLPRPRPALPERRAPHADLRDVRGQAAARRALEVAAAGGHSLLLVGPPGSGKSMLAQRLIGLLPPLAEAEALTSAAVHGLARPGCGQATPFGQRPFRAPHHSASAVALVGGGSPPRPGEISLAHGGVLFLDELPEFARQALEALREPLETGHITLSRAAHQARFPARFQLVAAMNPCPCGWRGAVVSGRTCRCTPEAVARYQARLSGPLLDRIDLMVEVPAQPARALMAAETGESSATVAERVDEARAWQQARQGGPNASASPDALLPQLTPSAAAFLESAATRLGWSGRAVHRVLRVARTVADLAASTPIDLPHLAEAVQYRRALEI
jgi:magnesium chelatase family protein